MKKLSKTKMREYSKIVIGLMIVLWFIGAVFGMVVVIWQQASGTYYSSLGELLGYIGAPMTGGVVAYLLKSAFENREKIKQKYILGGAEQWQPGEKDEP